RIQRQRLCPPYETVHYVESKENRPLFRLWARGSPSFLSSVSLENRGGWRATRRMAWITPDRPGSALLQGGPERRALAVKRHAPRLAARHGGILAFMPLTVVGPGRLLVAGEAARVRPGDEVASSIARRCRSRSPPSRRLMNAPLELGSGWITHRVKLIER